MRASLLLAVALVMELGGLAGVGACRGSTRQHRVAADAGPPPVPPGAPHVTTAAERDALFRAVPTPRAIHATIARLAVTPHPAGSPANEAVARDILSTLGRLGLRTGIADVPVLMPSFAGPMLVLELKPRPVRNLLAIIDGDVQDAIIVGATYDTASTSAAAHASAAALLEIARGLAALTRAGWHPHRTIILAWWDGGTIGDLGQAGWVEAQRDMLHASAVAYLDIATAEGTSRIEVDPVLARGIAASLDPAVREHITPASHAPLAFGSREAIPTARWLPGVTVGSEPGPPAEVEAAASRTAVEVGLVALRLATAPRLPYAYADVARALSKQLDQTRIRALGADPGGLVSALAAIALAGSGEPVTLDAPVAAVAPACERAMLAANRDFLRPDGLAGHAWYRNVLVGSDPDGEHALACPELATALAAADRPAVAVAIDHLTRAFERVATDLAPCAP